MFQKIKMQVEGSKANGINTQRNLKAAIMQMGRQAIPLTPT